MSPAYVRNVIGGQRTGEPIRERFNPADPSDCVAVAVSSDSAAVDVAVDEAQRALRGWRDTTAPRRGAVLLRAAEILSGCAERVATDLTREEGKTVAESRNEVARAVDLLRYFGSEGWRLGGQMLPSATPDTMNYTRREPMGVVGIITPWNFPIAIPAWKIAPALVSGNTVVLKPAELTPLSAQYLLNALTEAGMPPGVINVVHGPGAAAGEALVRNHRVAAVSFTGSTEVGRHIRRIAEERDARVQLEMGGKNALVVNDDADVVKAAQIAADGGFGLTGQACTATSRVICTPGVHDDFIEALMAEAVRYQPGNGLDGDVLMGPVVDHAQLTKNLEATGTASTEGFTVSTGGQRLDGLLFPPTVLTDVQPNQRVARAEIFGPIVAVMKVTDLDEAIALVNDTSYGLSASICTSDLTAVRMFSEGADVGVVKVNRSTTGLDLNVPFGGVKASSTNTFREQGSVAVDFYTWLKTVYLGWA